MSFTIKIIWKFVFIWNPLKIFFRRFDIRFKKNLKTYVREDRFIALAVNLFSYQASVMPLTELC